ncbi:MAG TPA: NIPSNAP family protein [Vicinamibacterales bacterium]|nr:NIPSNAP family protein [Vicinamibacterales bacterium]
MRIGQATALLLVGIALGALLTAVAADARAARRVFEIRTYTTHDGRLDALHARFRNHTMRLFEKHGMTNVAYWTPSDPALARNTLVYVLVHPSREAAKRSWEAFLNDPEWKKVKADSEADGPIVAKVDSVFGDATDYSPLR